MLCTPAEIEKKRRLAKQKLLEKQARCNSGLGVKVTPQNSWSSPTRAVPTSPVISKHFSINSKSLVDQRPNNNLLPTTKTFNVKPMMFNDESKMTATFVLIEQKRFQVKMSKYFNIAIDVMKTIPSKSYNANTCNWSFSLEHYDLLLSKFEPLASHMNVVKLPQWIHKISKYQNRENACYDFSIIDSELMDTLMPFQEESLWFAIEREGRCYIADEMGLGKTIQALAIAAYYRHDWPILIISTASTCASWGSTICKYIPSIPVMNIQMLSTKNDCIESPSVVITSYDMMTRRCDDLLDVKFGVCIFDESHILKNFKTKCFKAAFALSKVAKRVILLSGTPALSKPSELFTQLQLVDEGFFTNFMEYSKRYCEGKESPFGWDASGQSNLEELQIVLERFMIRRTKDGMSALELPDKVQEIVHLQLTTENLSPEEKIELQRLAGTDFNRVIKSDNQILPFFHNTAKIKMPSVCSYIATLIKEEKRKALIFAHHVTMLDGLERVLRNSCIDYIRIDGKTTNRESLVTKFQNNDRVRYALLSITAANAGITLTAAQIVIFTELHWTPSILAQAEARAHRIGQTQPVIIRYLIAPKTVDDYIWPMLQRKQKTLNHMNLTTDTYANFTYSKKEVKPHVPTNHIMKYFSPSKRVRDDVENNHANKIRKEDITETSRPLAVDRSNDIVKIDCKSTTGSSALCLAPSSSKTVDEFNDDFDDFFFNFSTQRSIEQKQKVPDADLFDDDMDDFFKEIPI